MTSTTNFNFLHNDQKVMKNQTLMITIISQAYTCSLIITWIDRKLAVTVIQVACECSTTRYRLRKSAKYLTAI